MNAIIRLFVDTLETPLGCFALVADDAGRLRASGFTAQHARMERQLQRYADDPAVNLTRTGDPNGLTSAVRRYFEGEVSALDGLPVVLDGTPFQNAVWRALADIPCGETRTYATLARQIGNPAAVRAVGLANGSNRIGLILPCHRVIGSDGSLTGYGGGVERKRWLLAHEARRLGRDTLSSAAHAAH